MRNPPRRVELGPVMEVVRQQWRLGDYIYVYNGARPGYFYYSRKTSFLLGAVTMGEEHRGDPTAYRVELAKLPRSGRIWLLFAHRHGREEFHIRASLDEDAGCLESINKPGAAVYLYQYEGCAFSHELEGAIGFNTICERALSERSSGYDLRMDLWLLRRKVAKSMIVVFRLILAVKMWVAADSRVELDSSFFPGG